MDDEERSNQFDGEQDKSEDGELQEESDYDDFGDEDEDDAQRKKEKDEIESKYKYGMIYLSYIPEGLNVKLLKEIMSQFGEVGRVYLEPDTKSKKQRSYVEGWVEFKKKRVAKAVAKRLNGTALQYGRKRCKFNGQVWSLKYLHRFKWAHLTQQLAHDKAIREQKRSFEMSQTKKHVDFYQKMTERSQRMKKTSNKRKTNDDDDEEDEKASERMKTIDSRQKRPVGHGQELDVAVDEDLLSSIFKKVA